MKLSRTSSISFGWLYVFPLLDVVFLLIFFFLLSSSFVLQPGIAVTVPFSRFTLGPQPNQQIISITGGPNPTIYLRDQKVTLAQLGPALDLTKQEGRSIVIKADRLALGDALAQQLERRRDRRAVGKRVAALERGITSVALATSPQP